jgi:hypothetical protein
MGGGGRAWLAHFMRWIGSVSRLSVAVFPLFSILAPPGT